MIKGKINKSLLLAISCLMFLLLPTLGRMQIVEISGQDILLKEYLFPISSYAESGNLNYKLGGECEGFALLSEPYASCLAVPSQSLPGLPAFTEAVQIKKWEDNKSVFTYEKAKFSYKFPVASAANFIFKISASNNTDNFSKLSRQQIDYILDQSNPNPPNTNVNFLLDYLGEGISRSDLSLIATQEDQLYQLFRSMVFSVYVDKEPGVPDYDEAKNKKGFIFIKNTDPSQIQEGSIKIDNLSPGEHTIYLHYLSDYYFDFYNNWNGGTCEGEEVAGTACLMDDKNACLSEMTSVCTDAVCTGGVKNGSACETASDCIYRGTCVSSLPLFLKEFSNADLDVAACEGGTNSGRQCAVSGDCPSGICPKSWTLDTNPIIYGTGINTIVPADDVIGIRIYSNAAHKDIVTWYQENVVNALPDVEPIIIDGYKAVRDERTIYVNAANIKETGTAKQFFTNIYVMAYNQAAPPTTITIFNQMLDNWRFNTNITDEETKNKLRRDMTRLLDLSFIDDLLKNYFQAHGKFPTLEAGTFVKGHSISTWPSWQATLGNQLGSGLPLDPLNIMTAENRGTYDCKSDDPNEKEKCVNICTRDSQGDPATGCPAGSQCLDDTYCSICPAPFDTLTCWEPISSKFAKETYTGCSPESKLNSAFNLGGTKCVDQIPPKFVKPDIYDGAFVYQYTSLDKGAAYQLNYRFEFQQADVCSPGQCYYDNGDDDTINDCYNPGSCLANCVDTNEDGILECSQPQYNNTYCYLGNWRNSCGNGFLESQCAEVCDPSVTMPEGQTWCDMNYTDQDWYTDLEQPACSSTCQLEGFNAKPLQYDPDPTAVSCGGYCGDSVKQGLYEDCDEGPDPASNTSAEHKSDLNQYMCSGKIGGKPFVSNGSACSQFSDDWDEPLGPSCPTSSSKVSFIDNNLISTGGFKVSYNYTVDKSGSYAFKISGANDGDDLSQLTAPQIDYLIELAKSGQPDMYNIDPASGDISIPEYKDTYGAIAANNPQKYSLLRSLVYSVYVDGDMPENPKGFLILSATNQDKKQEATISLGNLSSGPHTITLHFVGDHFYLPFGSLTLPDYVNNFSNADSNNDTTLDINPIIFSATLFSPELNVGSCKTYGGWCGDGIMQLDFGEQCDENSYSPPSPAETVNLAKNPSFEGIFSPWQIKEGIASLDQGKFFKGRYGLKIEAGGKTSIWLQQSNILFKDKLYKISLRVKSGAGIITNVSIQTGDESAENWSGTEVSLNKAVPPDTTGWDLYQANITPMQNSYKYRIIFTVSSDDAFNIDEVKIRAQDLSVQPQYQCGDYLNKSCQFISGFCGDGKKQDAWGENCDDRVGLSCASGEGCGAGGYCDSGVCKSDNCNEVCKSTYCGDGITQRPNSRGVYEICDPADEATCASDCQHIKMGGTCNSDAATTTCDPNTSSTCRECGENLSCSIRNFGDSAPKKCLGARGSLGCTSNNDCILGYYCDTSTTRCESEISTYTKYHGEDKTVLTLPLPVSPSVTYDINNSICPNFNTISTADGKVLLADKCSGLVWPNADNYTKDTWNYTDANTTGCGEGSALPNITELYSLVRQSNQGLFYSDKDKLRLCPLACRYDASFDLCSDCSDDNYLYWSSTCVAGNGTAAGCTKALAINFKYGSIEEYKTTDDEIKLKIHCLKQTKCGNGILEQGESCEFYTGAGGQKIEQKIDRLCQEFGYEAGFLHCDPISCTFRTENCLYYSKPNQTCEDVCQDPTRKTKLGCLSVGLNIEGDSYDPTTLTFSIADDARLMDSDGAGNCMIQDIATNPCDYSFIDHNNNCRDTGNNLLEPFKSQYSYCNCNETPSP